MHLPPNAQQQPYYPPESGEQQPPLNRASLPPTAARKPRRWPWIAAIIVALFIGYAAGLNNQSSDTTTSTTATTANTTQQSQATQAPAAPTKPAHAPKWTVTHTFSGSGAKKTEVFPVGDDWKLQWKCNPSSFMDGQYNLMVDVNNSDGTPADPGAINTICKAGNTGDVTEEHQGGKVYLDVSSEADWTLTVQELK